MGPLKRDGRGSSGTPWSTNKTPAESTTNLTNRTNSGRRKTKHPSASGLDSSGEVSGRMGGYGWRE